MVDEYEEELIKKAKKKFEKVIDKLCAEYDYLAFRVEVMIYSDGFKNVTDRIVLIDTTQKGYCAFCLKETHFIYSSPIFSTNPVDTALNEKYLCSECFGRIFRKKEEQKRKKFKKKGSQ